MPDLSDILRQAGTALGGNITVEAMRRVAADEKQELSAEQETSQLNFLTAVEEATNPFAAKAQMRRKEIKSRFNTVQKMLQSGEKAHRLTPVEKMKNTADEFQRKNPELKSSALVTLREMIKPQDTPEEILRKVLEFFPDVYLADEALQYLIETTEGELTQNVLNAKADLLKRFDREIVAGRNISRVAREASEQGLGAPTSLRDLYRDITGNPRDSQTLFGELAQKYAFKDLKKVIDFLFHSLGADLKAKGPSIPRGLLHRLLTETRSLQAIMGVYRFFRTRMRLIKSQFDSKGLTVPEQLNFELLAKQFMVLAGDRYPSADKALQLATKLGIEKWLIAKIIVLSQLRDAVREMAVNQIYVTYQHRDEVYGSLIEALERLEEELEELEEREEEEREKAEDERLEQERKNRQQAA